MRQTDLASIASEPIGTTERPASLHLASPYDHARTASIRWVMGGRLTTCARSEKERRRQPQPAREEWSMRRRTIPKKTPPGDRSWPSLHAPTEAALARRTRPSAVDRGPPVRREARRWENESSSLPAQERVSGRTAGGGRIEPWTSGLRSHQSGKRGGSSLFQGSP